MTEHPSQPVDALVIGEAPVDIVRRDDGVHESPGGGPANIALVLGRLGHSVLLRTALGDDVRGNRIRAWLSESHVAVEDFPLASTSTATAVLEQDGSARYRFDISWNLGDEVHPPSRVVHVGSIGSWLAPGDEIVATLFADARSTATTSLDPNIRPALIDDPDAARHRVESLIAAADIIKLSDEDLEWLYPGTDSETLAERWIREGPALVVVTEGASDAVATTGHFRSRVPAIRTAVSDTIGAGDTFMGTLLSSLSAGGFVGADRRANLRDISERDLNDVLLRATTAASIAVSRPGANPPWADELAAAMKGART